MMATRTKQPTSATARLAELDREVERAAKEPAALKRRIAADQEQVRADGAGATTTTTPTGRDTRS